MRLQPTLYFQGACKEAIQLYQQILDAELLFETPFKGHVDPAHLRPGTENMVLKAGLRIGESTIYVSDGHCAGTPSFQGFSLSLSVDSEERATRIITALAEDGKVLIPLQRSAQADLFGTIRDKFGVHWTFQVPGH